MGEFMLGDPAVVCRWRLWENALPLENRHLRALAARKAPEGIITTGLLAWTKQHLEWTLEEGSALHPSGVLMLVVDKSGKAAMTVGAYEKLTHTAANDLLQRAVNSRKEALELGVSPEDLWACRDGMLIWSTCGEFSPSGSSSLIADLARTLGIPVQRDEGLLDKMASSGVHADEEVFLVSDEHGVVVAHDHDGPRAQKFAASYQKLLDSK